MCIARMYNVVFILQNTYKCVNIQYISYMDKPMMEIKHCLRTYREPGGAGNLTGGGGRYWTPEGHVKGSES